MSSNDLENMAIASLIAGIASAIFIILGAGPGMQFWGLLAGVFAVGAGVRVLRGEASNKKLAATGTIMGTIGLACWVLITLASFAAFVWHRL